MPITFGNVPHPPFIDRLVPDAETTAWDDLGPRRPVGTCQHSMLGTLWGTDKWFRRGRASTGLTDYGIGGATDGAQWDGVIVRWNDPLGRAATGIAGEGDPGSLAVSANRAGWANGGSDGLEGDGPLFVRRLGVAAINRDLVSIERSDGGKQGTPISPKQFAAICQLTAHWFDRAHVPWNQFPFNPGTGCVTHLLHREFATKGCPYPPVVDRIDEIQARVREILRLAQEGDASAPTTPAKPTPDHGWWPASYTQEGVASRFGTLRRRLPDGGQRRYRFDPKGVISNAWVARGAGEGMVMTALPRPLGWWTLATGDGRTADLVLFEEGWSLYRPDPAVAWGWLE